jgi:hypothetical protein
MRSLIEHLAHTAERAPQAILVVGAGNGAELPALRRLGSARLILAEAHPGQAQELAQRIDPAQGEEVWPLAITATPMQQATLKVMNNPLHSSLKTPGELGKHFPNLRMVDEINVRARALGEAMESLGLDMDNDNLLVVDAPGQLYELLHAAPVDCLQSFAWIIVHCGIVPLYTDDHACDECIQILRDHGFDVAMDDTDAIYPHGCILLKRDDARVQLQRLQAQLQKNEAELERTRLVAVEQQKLAAERQAHIQKLTQDQSAVAARNKTELEKADQSIAEQKKLLAVRDAKIAELAQAHLEQQKLAADGQTRIQDLMNERDEQSNLAAQYKSELEETRQVAAEQQKLAADRQAHIHVLTQERDEQTKTAAKQKAELDKVTQTSSEQHKLATDRQAHIQKLTQERDEQAKLAAEKKIELEKALAQSRTHVGRIAELETEHAELQYRQSLLSQEMIKAEAQVELIKDVLLREPGL